MLGTIGFSAAALMFVLYGLTSADVAKKTRFPTQTYMWAYIAAGLAAVSWAIGTVAGSDMLESWVLVGDTFIMVATVLLLRTLVPAKVADLYSVLGAATLGAALVYRALNTGPNPVMRDSILAFNTPRLFGAFLAFVLLLVWLRSNMLFYREVVAKTAKTDLLRLSYFSSNMLGFLGVSAFLFAHKSITIVVGFSMVVLAFATMVGLNYAVRHNLQKETAHGK